MNPNFILLAIPIFLLTIGIEYIYGLKAKKQYYNFEDFITNMNMGIGNQAFNALFKGFLLMVYDYIFRNFAIFSIELSVLSVIGCLIVYDFVFYWAHRWGHEWNIYWGAHVVHHQSEEYNFSVALRQPWFHNLVAFVLFLPIPFLGFNTATFVIASAVQLLYQYWIHTRHIKKLGPFEWIFNTPSHHRVHHATNPKYLDKNYGGMLIIWDRLFGTFKVEEEEPTYGITIPLSSWNPVWANFHFYVDLWKGMKMEKTLGAKLALLFKGPEHLGKMLGQKSMNGAGAKLKKYATTVPLNMQIYVMLQFIVLIYGVGAYMGYYAELSWFYRIFFLALIVLTTLNCGAIMENKKWTNTVEIVRLLTFLPIYNSLFYLKYQEWFLYAIITSTILAAGFLVWLAINYWYYNTRPKAYSHQK